MAGTTDDRRELEGSCHCGAMTLRLRWPNEPLPARECGCTFCRERAARWTSHPDASLRLRLTGEDACSRYRFGTRTADFLVCRSCGSVLAAICEIERRCYAVVNVRALRGADVQTADVQATDFDGEATEDRLDRRRRSWIPDVETSVG